MAWASLSSGVAGHAGRRRCTPRLLLLLLLLLLAVDHAPELIEQVLPLLEGGRCFTSR